MSIKSVFINFVDGLGVAGFATDAGIVNYTSSSSVTVTLKWKDNLHVKLSISLNGLCDQSPPAVGLANVDFDKYGLAPLLGNPLMGSNILTLAERPEVSTDEECSFHEELIANLSSNTLGRAGDDRDAILKTLTRHGDV
jgi:hypothetical protein